MRQPDLLTPDPERFTVGEVFDLGGIGIFYRVLDVQPYHGQTGVWLEELKGGTA
jgi:hypothetical protein